MKNKIFFTTAVMLLLITMALCINVSAAGMPASHSANQNLKAIDISEYQKDATINWPTLKKNVSIIYIRASIRNYLGTTRADYEYKTFASKAQSYGISHGFYHYFRPSKDSSVNKAQADFFYNAIKDCPYDCVPVVDCEDATDCGSSVKFTKSQYTEAVQQFASEFKAKSGLDIMIYSSNDFIDNYLGTSLSKYKLWIANWSDSGPAVTSVWKTWDMWQYTSIAKVNGFSGIIDADIATSNVFLNDVSGIATIDSPSGTYGKGDIWVHGWAISHYGVERVDIYIDGKEFTSISKGDFVTRSDVEKAYAGRGYDDTLNSGYSTTIPAGSLSYGSHTIRVKEIDGRGNEVWSAAKNFFVDVPDDEVHIDSPYGNYVNNVTVSGWALSSYGITRADIYLDGSKIASINSSDFTAYPYAVSANSGTGFINAEQSGFLYTIPDELLTFNSTHTLSVETVNGAGKTASCAKTFTVGAPPNLVSLEKPSGTYIGDVDVSGWAISGNRVKSVEIYVDGKKFTSISSGSFTERSDIQSMYGDACRGYSDVLHSGFSYTIPYSQFSSGSHTIAAAEIDNTGEVLWSAQKVITII